MCNKQYYSKTNDKRQGLKVEQPVTKHNSLHKLFNIILPKLKEKILKMWLENHENVTWNHDFQVVQQI